MSDWNEQIIKEFRANEGKVGGYFKDNRLLLLHTTGAKSGKERVNPLVTIEDGQRLVVIASKGGAPSHPDWYYNLKANPQVTVEYGTETFSARAEIAAEPERTELYGKMEEAFANFTEYKQKAGRVIPVITLVRAG
jgi:deazaflavin-dependent oxidoreductase (nitroreductase family)